MGKLVILELGDGDFEQGFRVTLEILTDENRLLARATGRLPAAPEILGYYNFWHLSYRQLDLNARSSFLEAPEAQATNISITEQIKECTQSAQTLKSSLQTWYDSPDFSRIREKLLTEIDRDESVCLVMRTNSSYLWQIPWQLFWERFLDRYHQVEVALSTPEYDKVEIKAGSREKVKILVVLGNSTGINVVADQRLLQSLPNADPTFLAEPTWEQLNEQLWNHEWDILFFAGHSSSQDGCGRIFVNQTESLTIAELKYALRNAINKGLKLAIFNSCDGLGLARDLGDLHIPQIIVMREPIPDRVAQEFLKFFLNAFSSGKSLHAAVREARERLQPLELYFPGVTWLPAICQNLIGESLTWQSLYVAKQQKTGKKPKLSLLPLGLIGGGLIVAAALLITFQEQILSIFFKPSTIFTPTPTSSSSQKPTIAPLPKTTLEATPTMIGTAIVIEPLSNVRASPNGEILCSVKDRNAINIFGSVDSWYYTNFCGTMGVIHSSQVTVSLNSVSTVPPSSSSPAPTIAIPPSPNPSPTESELTFDPVKRKKKLEIVDAINKYLQAKDKIFAVPYDSQLAATVVTGKALEEVNQEIDRLKKDNSYYHYKVSKAEPLAYYSAREDWAQIEVKVTQEFSAYKANALQESKTSVKDFRFTLQLEKGVWKISEIQDK